MGGLAGKGLGLRVGHVARLADGVGDALLRGFSELLELAVEVIGDRCGGGFCELGDVYDRDPAGHALSFRGAKNAGGIIQILLDVRPM